MERGAQAGKPSRRSRASRAEMPAVRDMLHRAADAVETYLLEGPEPAMNRFNAEDSA